MRSIKLRILDQKKHKELVKDFDYEMKEESNLYAIFINLTEIQQGQLEYSIEHGVYRLCGDEDYDFEEITTNDKHNYKNFEDYYNQHKAEYMNNASSGDRERKRVHESLHDIIHYVSRYLKCNNVTATTTMLLQFGTYEFYNYVSKDDFEIINEQYFKNSASSFKHKQYDDGVISKIVLSAPARKYKNSREMVLDANGKNKQISFYQTEYVFKTLESIHRVGFDGSYSQYGYELLITLALSKCDLIEGIDIMNEMVELSEPTMQQIKKLTANIC